MGAAKARRLAREIGLDTGRQPEEQAVGRAADEEHPYRFALLDMPPLIHRHTSRPPSSNPMVAERGRHPASQAIRNPRRLSKPARTLLRRRLKSLLCATLFYKIFPFISAVA
ncbi:hypothetical protein O0544_18560 [Edwardsiella anguillarum]|nr:hypothetical protein [Edwardsiella anguillarum]